MNSGAEAVETAIKLARKWGYQNKKVPSDKAKILTFQNNFHGRTITIVSFSTEDNYRAGFGPYTPGFDVVEFDDLAAAEKAIDANTVGVLVEPIQAEAGIIVPKDGYLKGLRKLCDTKGVLLMLDEIQTGMGRTGQDFCYQHEGIQPDLLILGKSLGGGLLPISAVIGKHDVMKVIQPGQHGSTFGGNPLACAVAREALKVLRQEELSERANQVGQWIRRELSQAKLPHVREIRGKGALIGIELDESSGGARKYCERMMEKGVLCKETHTYVIRIAPPLIISESEIQKGIEVIIETIQSLGQGAR
jgi:ornithine--oxo-acid transaminase